MVVTSDYEGIRGLLTETVTVLCQNSMKYKNKIKVDGLLCINLDDEDVVVLKISKEIKIEQNEGINVSTSKKRKHEEKKERFEEDSRVHDNEKDFRINNRDNQDGPQTPRNSDKKQIHPLLSNINATSSATPVSLIRNYHESSNPLSMEIFPVDIKQEPIDDDDNMGRFTGFENTLQNNSSFMSDASSPFSGNQVIPSMLDVSMTNQSQERYGFMESAKYTSRPERKEVPPGCEADIRVTSKGSVNTVKAHFEGYCYTKNRIISNRTYWRCQNRKCKGRIVTRETMVLSKTEHHHLPDDSSSFMSGCSVLPNANINRDGTETSIFRDGAETNIISDTGETSIIRDTRETGFINDMAETSIIRNTGKIKSTDTATDNRDIKNIKVVNMIPDSLNSRTVMPRDNTEASMTRNNAGTNMAIYSTETDAEVSTQPRGSISDSRIANIKRYVGGCSGEKEDHSKDTGMAAEMTVAVSQIMDNLMLSNVSSN